MHRRATALLLLAACRASHPYEAQAPCDHAGYAIAARIQACTGDGAAANQAFDDFQEQTTCLLDTKGEPTVREFQCSVDLAALDCEAVAANGSDWAAWVAGTDCPAIVDAGQPLDTGVAR